MKDYNKIDPNSYMEFFGDESFPDYSKLEGVPIKLGRDATTKELFDEITAQLIDDGLVELVEIDNKSFVSFKDDSSGYAASMVHEDKGDGVMVTFNENGTLSYYDENQLDKGEASQEYDSDEPDIDYEEEEEELY